MISGKYLLLLSLVLTAAASTITDWPCYSVLIPVPVLGSALAALLLEWGSLAYYLSMAVGLYYASVSVGGLVTLPILAISLLLSHTHQSVSGSAHAESYFGPSTRAALAPLPFFLIASVANLRLIFSAGILSAAVLIAFLLTYHRLSYSVVEGIEYPSRVALGEEMLIKIRVRIRDGFADVEVGGVRQLYRVMDHSEVVISYRPSWVGKVSLPVRVTAMDKHQIARRTVHRATVTVIVYPNYTAVIRRYGRLLEAVPGEALEPVKITVRPLGSGGIRGSGSTSVNEIIMNLPEFLRRVAIGIIEGIRKGGAEGVSGGSSPSLIGEYYGVREYVSGDSPKVIHWKKSVALKRIVVKEFVSGNFPLGGAPRRMRYVPAIVADLTSTNLKELDLLITKLINTVAVVARAHPRARVPLIIALGPLIFSIEGPALNVLKELAEAVTKALPRTIIEYDSIGDYVDPEDVTRLIKMGGCCSLVRAVAAASRSYAEAVAASLLSLGLLPPKRVGIMYGRASSTRNAFLVIVLRNSGYSVTNLGPSIN